MNKHKAIETFEIRNDYLFVVARGGVRRHLLQASQGAIQLANLLEISGKNLAIFDYRSVEFDVNRSDPFNIVRFYEQFPVFLNAKIASVINKATIPIATTWLEYAKLRGFQFECFLTVEEAEEWLLAK